MAKQWYIIHTYSGFEIKVARASSSGRRPSAWATRSARSSSRPRTSSRCATGKKVVSSKKFFPGYVLDQHGDVRQRLARREEHAEGHGLRRQRDASRCRSPTEEVDRIINRVTGGGREAEAEVRLPTRARRCAIVDGPFANFTGIGRRGQRGPLHAEGDGHHLRRARRRSSSSSCRSRRLQVAAGRKTSHGEEDQRLHQAARSRRQGDAGAAGRPGARPARA